ncbi:MAG TPA: DUF4157 domain-containing protein [Gammaproteobacteria bacterium]
MKLRATSTPSQPAMLQRKPFFAQRGAFFARPRIQPTLTVGQAGDRFEQEADAMADRVLRMPSGNSPSVQQKCESCAREEGLVQRQETEEEEELLQAKPASAATQAIDSAGGVSPDVEQQLQTNLGGGNTLPANTQQQMNSAFGADFSSVRLHTGSQAVQLSGALGARAFTYGRDVFFNQQGFNPHSSADQHLLAHELTHVIQQGGVAGTQVQNKSLASRIQRRTATPNLQMLQVTYPTAAHGHVQHSSHINNTYYVDWTAWIEDDVLLFEFTYYGSDAAAVQISLFDSERNGYIGGGWVRWSETEPDTQFIEFSEFPLRPSGEIMDSIITRTELINETRESRGIGAYKKIYRG